MANVSVAGIVVLALLLAIGTMIPVMAIVEGVKIYKEKFVYDEEEESET